MADDDLKPPTKWERAIGIAGGILVTLIVLYLVVLFLIWLTGKALS